MANCNDQTGCYVPDPKYTFLFAPRADLPTCAICTDSKLTLPSSDGTSFAKSTAAAIRDSDPSLLPCGHVFGSLCLQRWLRSHDTCPACRFALRYELCQHPVAPRRLTRENVMFAPPTVGVAAKLGVAGAAAAAAPAVVGTQCVQCRRDTDLAVARELWMLLARRFYELKGKSQKEKLSPEAAHLLASMERLMDTLVPKGERQW